MSDSTQGLRHKIASAGDLQSVVRTMKAVAAAGVGQYEQSTRALGDYYRTVQLGLSVCLRQSSNDSGYSQPGKFSETGRPAIVVFGSDQGLVGRLNEDIVDFTVKSIASIPGDPRVWAVGERVQARLADAGLSVIGLFAVPGAVDRITDLVADILLRTETGATDSRSGELHLFYNRPLADAQYTPVTQRLLPLDERWRRDLVELPWPTKVLPEMISGSSAALRALIGEHLFVSLFRACAESLASENASRLAAMQRADKNIADMLATLNGTFHRLRQSDIDEELFDVVSGFEALSNEKAIRSA